MLKNKNRFVQVGTVVLILIFIAVNLYFSLVKAFLMGVDDSNEWA
jgi:hypothetical protein